MDEKKIEEILDRKLDEKLDQKLEEKLSVKFAENNKFLLNEISNLLDNKISESERNQNRKFAYFEHVYGEKISAIFDKITSIEEMLADTRVETIKNQNQIKHQDDILFEHSFRISNLEKKVNSK